jgi:hypothetical protein
MTRVPLARAGIALLATLLAVGLLAAPAAAEEPGPGQVSMELECPDGSWVTVIVPDPPSDADIAAAAAASCPTAPSTGGSTVPSGDGPAVKVASRSLFAQTLWDLRQNEFFIKVKCSRKCWVRSSVQAIVLSPRALPVSIDVEKELPAGTWTRVRVPFRKADRAIFRKASKVRVTGFVEARDAKGRDTTYQWERTCRLAS